MTRKAGDTYRPIVHILKVKKDKPTVIKVSGGSTLRAAAEMGRHAYGFEVYKEFYEKAQNEMLTNIGVSLF